MTVLRSPTRSSFPRRWFIGGAVAALACPAHAQGFSCESIASAWRPANCHIPEPHRAAAPPPDTAPRSVAPRDFSTRRFLMEHPRVGERLDVVYYRDGQYDGAALQAIYRIMRDARTGEARRISTPLIDTLALILHLAGTDRPLILLSGFRSLSTNEMLIARSIAQNGRSGVARNSFHLAGRASDVNHPVLNLDRLARLGREAGAGGVSPYSSSNFVHFDDGPVRGAWSS